MLPKQKANASLQQSSDLESLIKTVRREAPKTGTYPAALLAAGNVVPTFSALLSTLLYIAPLQLLGFRLSATLCGTVFVVLCWLLIAIPYTRFTAVDSANSGSYELLLNRLNQVVAWYATLITKPSPEKNTLYFIRMNEVLTSFNAICASLSTKSTSWALASGYVNVWKLIHRIDEALIAIEPIEAVIHDALHDEMSLQGSTIRNKDELLNKLRRAVKTLDPEAALYLNQQPPQDDKTASTNLQDNLYERLKKRLGDVLKKLWLAMLSPFQSNAKPGKYAAPFSDTVDKKTQARTIIHEVRLTLHQFRDDRWEKLVRVRNQLKKMTFVTGFVLYVLVECSIILNVDVVILQASTILFVVGGLVGLFSRLYNQSKTDTSVDDFRLSSARLFAAPLYSGLSAVGGVLVVHQALKLDVPSILVAAAFGLTPSLFTNAIQNEADQYKADLRSTAAPSGEQAKSSTA